MEQVASALTYVTLVVYVALAVVAGWQWQRRGGRAAMWLAVTFGSVGAIVLWGQVAPEPTPDWVTKVVIVVLAAFPYALYRFTREFAPRRRAVGLTVDVLAAVVVLYSLALPRLVEAAEPQPWWYVAFLVLFLSYWVIGLVLPAILLWHAGRGQPQVARNRMRVMALGAISMALALIVQFAITQAQGAEETPAVATLVGQALAILAGGAFYLGFAPPTVLRALWRRPAERALRDAQLGLVAAVEPGDVARALLPFVQRVFGGAGAVLIDRDGEVVGRDALSEDEAADTARRMSDDGGIARPDEVSIPLKSGYLVMRVSTATPYFGEEELELLAVLGSFTDLALERADLHRRELEARREVERTNAELEALVYGISHDLKNPIITLLGYVDLVRNDYGERLDDEGRHFLNRMAVSAAYMEQLLTDLLELSRVGRMQTEPEAVPLAPLVEDIAEEVRREYPGATLAVGDLPTVLINPVRARQLFTNLIVNSARHGGREDVTIRVETATESDGDEEGATVVLADDGRGIPDVYRDRVFGIFERLEDGGVTTEGTGIGLAICRRIVETFDGHITIEDAPVGTTFHITFPADVVVPSSGDPSMKAMA